MRLRNEVIIGTMITGLFLTAWYMEYIGVSQVPIPSSSVKPSSVAPSNGTTQNPQAAAMVMLTASEVAKHNTEANCWLIIGTDVYDVTNYLRLHPGGISRITPYCGSDATQAYATQGGRGSHSGAANQQKDMLKIGLLNGTTDTKTIQNVQETTKQQTPLRGRREFEDED